MVWRSSCFGFLQEFACDNDGRGGSVSDFVVLGLCDLNHHLCCRVLDIHLFEDGNAIVGDDNIADGVDEHLVHALWTKGSSDCTCNCLCCSNVHALGIPSTGTGTAFFKNQNRLSAKLC